jgi:hypothetical protein
VYLGVLTKIIMKHLFALLLSMSLYLPFLAQDMPLKIEVPALSTDPNMQYNLLHFDVMGKDKFSTFQYHTVSGSVLHNSEFVSDTGQTVFKDRKHETPIYNSSFAILLKKQIFDGTGKLLNSEEWLLAARRLDVSGDFKLYFTKGAKHPVVANRTVIDKSIYNLDAVKGLSEAEMAALVEFTRGMIPKENEPVADNRGESTLAEDILATRRQFKSLRSTGLLFKGDLPSSENVLTRYNIVSDRAFVITSVKNKDKTKPNVLKFYVTEDYKTFDCLDSASVMGDLTLTSAATIYNTDAAAIGAFANIHVKSKDEKGEEILQQFSVAMDADYKIGTWLHSVGKNKLNSLSPEVCWYEGSQLWVMSNNRERIFKTYVQMHLFEKGKAATNLFPVSEEEKGSEKSKFVKTYQPTAPNGVGSVAPIPEKYVPIYFTTAGETRYIIMQGTRFDEPSKNRQYLSVNIYRIDGKGKVTNVDMLSDYKAFIPLPLPRIIKNPGGEFFLLQYPVKLQLGFYSDRSEIIPLDVDNSSVMQKIDKEYLCTSPYGSALLRRTNMGTKTTLLFYPKM